MKNKLFIGLLLLLFIVQACVKDEEKVFDASAAERMAAALSAHKAALVSATNGWLVEYYPEDDRSMGGYHFIWKFNADGTVQMVGEMPTANYPAGDTATSTYNVIANGGAILTFNTYNEVLHVFVEPWGAPSVDVDGYAGDYEFVIREVTPEQIVMTGKKYGNKLLMTPYTGDASTWAAYLSALDAMDKKMVAMQYMVNVNDTAAAGFDVATREFRAFHFTYKNPEHNRIVSYITTPTGIKTYEPLTVDGETAQYFTFNEAERKLIGEGGHITIELGAPPPPLNVWFATMTANRYGYLRAYSNSVLAFINMCEANVLNEYNEELVYILFGNSPFASSPGQGVIFGSYNPTDDKVWIAQFFYTFTPVGDELAIAYSGTGRNGTLYLPFLAPLLNALTDKSPYIVTGNDPISPTEVTLTSAADPDFYFVITDFDK
jgi:hypothetical protein